MEEAWMKFEATGSVMDYLRFKEIEAEKMLRQNGLKCDADWRL